MVADIIAIDQVSYWQTSVHLEYTQITIKMPAKVKVRILAGRNLPVMDKSSDASDAFVEVKLANTTYKTEVYRRSLNPFWNSEWFRFEVTDQELQDEPLQVRIMDYDTYSANDAIGKVYINLNPLLVTPSKSMSGWLPIYDTLHGIRGEINCMVKVNIFADNNRFRQSSCGVRFFFSDIPNGYQCEAILGFVDELLVNDDPEYQWIDKIRTPRASNEARQTLFTKLSGEVQRKLGLKAEILGGNAVIGYQQSFDLEGGSGIVGRGIGTAVVLTRIGSNNDRLISPVDNPNDLFLYTAGHSNAIQNRTSVNSSQNQMMGTRYRGANSRSPLVHSISADYFYEVPTLRSTNVAALNPNSPDGIPVSRTTHDFDSYKSLDADETSSESSMARNSSSDIENYETSSDDNHNSISIRNLNQNADNSRTVGSIFRSIRPPKLSIAFRDANFRKKASRKLSANELFARFHQNNYNSNNNSGSLAHRLAQVTFRPISQTNKLTMLLSQTKTDAKSKSSESSNQIQGTTISKSRKSNKLQKSKGLSQKSSDSSKKDSIDASIKASSSDSQHNSNSSPKRKRDLSQSTSIEDGLSTIEEKFDDDHRSRQSFSSNNDPLQKDNKSNISRIKGTMERRKEIDLADDEHNYVSADDDDASSSQASTIIGAKGFQIGEDSSIAEITKIESHNGPKSDSQFSVATLTDLNVGTMKQSSSATSSSPVGKQAVIETNKNSTSSPNWTKSQSLAIDDDRRKLTNSQASSSKQNETMKSTDCDNTILKRSESVQPAAKQSSSAIKNKQSHSIKQDTTGRKQQQASNSTATTKNNLAANLTKSVGVMKAQQHLLENLVKHQNQHLIPNLNQNRNKVRSVFIYPNFGEHRSEYPFVTFKKFPDKMIRCTGGVVSVHSVKLLDHIINDEESETRDIWWTEIRKEISCHAKALNCNTIIGYRETSKVMNDICILSAYGTAALMSPTKDDLYDVQNDSNYDQYHNQHMLTDRRRARTSGVAPSNSGRNSRQKNYKTDQSWDIHEDGKNLRLPDTGSSPPPSHTSMPVPTSSSLLSPNHMYNSESLDSWPSRNINGNNNSAVDQNDNESSSAIVIQQEASSSNGDQSLGKNLTLPLSTNNFIDQDHSPRSDAMPTNSFDQQNSNDSNQQAQKQTHKPIIDCSFCHTPLICFDSINLLSDCSICKQAKVPDVLLLTIEPPTNLNIVSKGFLVQARVCRSKRDLHGEVGAKEIGDALPFLEYELHRQMFSKLMFRGLNCLFNLTVDISVGENMISGLATGTGCFVLGLRQPEPPRISGGKGIKTSKLLQIQRLIESTSLKNRQILGMDDINAQLEAYHQELTVLRNIRSHSASSQHDLDVDSTRIVGSSSDYRLHQRVGQQHQNQTLNSSNNLTSGSRKLPISGAAATDVHLSSSPPQLQSVISESTTSYSSPPPPLQQSAPTSNLLNDDNSIILEVDDTEDANIIALLIDSEIPEGYVVCNSESVPLIDQSSITNINMFTQVMRAKLTGLDQFGHLFDWILQALFVKLRRSLPCCLTNVTYTVDLPESNVVQVTISGCLLAMQKKEQQQLPSISTNLHELAPSASQNSLTSRHDNIANSPISSENRKSSISCELVVPTNQSTTDVNVRSKPGHHNKAVTITTSTSASPRTSSSVSNSSDSLDTTTSSSSSSSNRSSTSLSSALSAKHSSAKEMKKQHGKKVSKSSSPESKHQHLNVKTNLLSSPSSSPNSATSYRDKDKAEKVEKSGFSKTGSKFSISGRFSKNQQPPNKVDKSKPKEPIESSENNDKNQTSLTNQPIISEHPSNQQRTQLIRTVFKKQQTYPGAICPTLSGQDDKMATFFLGHDDFDVMGEASSSGGGGGTSGSGKIGAARRATILLNKVKQPLKELGSNFIQKESQQETYNNNLQPKLGYHPASATNLTSAKFIQRFSGASTTSTSHNRPSSTASTSPKGQQIQHSSSGGSRRNSSLKQSSHGGPIEMKDISGPGSAAATSMASQIVSTQISTNKNQQQHHHHPHHHQQQQQQAANSAIVKQHRHHHPSTSSASQASNAIEISSLSYMPGAKEYHYLGNLSFSFVRETGSVRENGGLNGFIHCFLMEVFAIVRAHVSALGGNALLSLRLQQSCIWYHSNKNQAQCLISVAGDAVQVVF